MPQAGALDDVTRETLAQVTTRTMSYAAVSLPTTSSSNEYRIAAPFMYGVFCRSPAGIQPRLPLITQIWMEAGMFLTSYISSVIASSKGGSFLLQTWNSVQALARSLQD